MDKVPEKEAGRGANLRLSTPWRDECIDYSRGNVVNQEGRYLSEGEAMGFITARTQLHEVYIREVERTRRIGMVLAASLLAIAALLPVFAPEGREALSQWVALALFVFAAGAMGFTSIKLASERRQLSVTKEPIDG